MDCIPGFVWKQAIFEVCRSRVSRLTQLSRTITYAWLRFIFATESYGGHYGPSFVTYFEDQNALIASGEIDAVPVVVSALMINKQVAVLTY